MENLTTLDDHLIAEEWDKYESPVQEGKDFDYCYCQSCGDPVIPSYYPEHPIYWVIKHIVYMAFAIGLLIAGGVIWDAIQIHFH